MKNYITIGSASFKMKMSIPTINKLGKLFKDLNLISVYFCKPV